MLADGVAHASSKPSKLPGPPPELIVDVATLTGAQSIATGNMPRSCCCSNTLQNIITTRLTESTELLATSSFQFAR